MLSFFELEESGGTKPFDEKTLRNFVIEHDWNGVEEELKQILPVKNKKDCAKLHPHIFLPVYDEWMSDHIRKQEACKAFNMFGEKIVDISKAHGEFVNKKDVKAQVNRLHLVANEKARVTAEPAAAEKMGDTLVDYLHLYFPDLTGHKKACEGFSHLWRFAKRLHKPDKQKDPNFRCLACGKEFKNCTISKIRNHLNVESGERNTCPKLTENMLSRFKDGENDKNAQMQKVQHESAQSKRVGQAKKGKSAKHNPPEAEENSENIGSLADEVYASIRSLHAATVGKILDREVEARLQSAKKMLNEIVP